MCGVPRLPNAELGTDPRRRALVGVVQISDCFALVQNDGLRIRLRLAVDHLDLGNRQNLVQPRFELLGRNRRCRPFVQQGVEIVGFLFDDSQHLSRFGHPVRRQPGVTDGQRGSGALGLTCGDLQRVVANRRRDRTGQRGFQRTVEAGVDQQIRTIVETGAVVVHGLRNRDLHVADPTPLEQASTGRADVVRTLQEFARHVDEQFLRLMSAVFVAHDRENRFRISDVSDRIAVVVVRNVLPHPVTANDRLVVPAVDFDHLAVDLDVGNDLRRFQRGPSEKLFLDQRDRQVAGEMRGVEHVFETRVVPPRGPTPSAFKRVAGDSVLETLHAAHEDMSSVQVILIVIAHVRFLSNRDENPSRFLPNSD